MLPRTYAKHREFVHFISAKKHLQSVMSHEVHDLELNRAFMQFESSLRSFLI